MKKVGRFQYQEIPAHGHVDILTPGRQTRSLPSCGDLGCVD